VYRQEKTHIVKSIHKIDYNLKYNPTPPFSQQYMNRLDCVLYHND